jgi:hypothetical protein
MPTGLLDSRTEAGAGKSSRRKATGLPRMLKRNEERFAGPPRAHPADSPGSPKGRTAHAEWTPTPVGGQGDSSGG